MLSGFCFQGNNLNKLLPSTPYSVAKTNGYYIANSDFDTAEFVISFRFKLTNLTNSESCAVQNTNSITGAENFGIFTMFDELWYSNESTAAVKILGAITAETWYWVEIGAYEESFSVFTYNMSSGVKTYDSYALTTVYPENSLITVLNNYTANSPFEGTICDLWFENGGSTFGDYMKEGGYFYRSTSFFFTMKEGDGSVCRNLLNPANSLTTGGSWTAPTWIAQDNGDIGRKWV